MKGRLSWICHGPTEANRSGRFPADETLEERGLRQAEALADGLQPVDRVWVSPALRARATSEALGLAGVTEPALRECDYGRWRGQTIVELHQSEPDMVAMWMTYPGSAPHGGESFSEVFARVGDWMEAHIGDCGHSIAVTHATVVRAAILHVLQAPATAFWTIDLEPLSIVEMTSDGRRWQLRFANSAR